jgi:selenophosphate synthetase-related protein
VSRIIASSVAPDGERNRAITCDAFEPGRSVLLAAAEVEAAGLRGVDLTDVLDQRDRDYCIAVI